MTVTTASFGSAGPAPSHASLGALDAVNFFVAGILAGFGPYVAAYLADQKWNQENIGFVLTASSLAGLLSQLPGGELLDTVRSKRAIIVAGVIVVAISAIIIAFEPRFPLVFIALMLQGITGGLLGLWGPSRSTRSTPGRYPRPTVFRASGSAGMAEAKVALPRAALPGQDLDRTSPAGALPICHHREGRT